jgi:uncharacterized protein (TIGR04255 family)
VTDLRFDDYLQDLGGGSSGLPTGGFMHQDILGVPGHPYAATLIRTMQPPETPQPASLSLIIDVDVFCPEPFPIAAGTISSRLAEMHWVRNKVFFGSITTKTKKLFQ